MNERILQIIAAPKGTLAHFEPDSTDSTGNTDGQGRAIADRAEVVFLAVIEPVDGDGPKVRALVYEEQTDVFTFAGDRSDFITITHDRYGFTSITG